MTFTDPIRRGLGKIVPLQMGYVAAKHASSAAWRPAQSALDTAHTMCPGAEFVRLSLPTPDKPYFVVRLRQRGETRAWSGATTVTIGALDGRVLQVQDGLRGPVANRVLDAQFSIHNGEAGGLAGRLINMAAGFNLPMFYVTGLWLWFRRRKIRSDRPGSGQRPSPAVLIT